MSPAGSKARAPRNAPVRITLRHVHLRRAVVGHALNTTAAANDIDPVTIYGSEGVAVHSLHIEGKAIDISMPGRTLAQLRGAALAQRSGGVGYYPKTGFVHVDGLAGATPCLASSMTWNASILARREAVARRCRSMAVQARPVLSGSG